jgi:hypothetical protein
VGASTSHNPTSLHGFTASENEELVRMFEPKIKGIEETGENFIMIDVL